MQIKCKKVGLVLMWFFVAFFTGCMAINAITTPYFLYSERVMGKEGMYEYTCIFAHAPIYVTSDSSSTLKPSNHVIGIAETMAIGEHKPYRLVIDGDLPDKTAKIIIAAASINKGKKLTKLKLMYVGSEEHKEKVQEAVESLGAKFYFYKYEPKLPDKNREDNG